VNLFDSSALLSFLQGEVGADVVERALEDGGGCSAVNWSEAAQKVRSRGGDWPLARGLLLSYEVRVEPVLEEDAELAATLWRAGSGLSLADRLCLATADRLDATVWTADSAWGTSERVRQVR
jgi:ribonuclease VapC